MGREARGPVRRERLGSGGRWDHAWGGSGGGIAGLGGADGESVVEVGRKGG